MDYQAIADLAQRAVAHQKSGETAEAEALYQEILAQQSGADGGNGELDANANLLFANAYNNLGVLLRIGKESREAIDHFREALDLAPGHVEAMTNLGIMYLGQGNKEGAVELLDEALKLQPDYLPARISLGEAHASLGRHEEAAEAYGYALGSSPPDARLLTALGQAKTDAGSLEDAVAAFRKAIEVDAAHFPAHNGLGKALFLMQATDEAAGAFARAAELAPGDPLAYNNLGLCHQSEDATEKAVAAFRKALALEPAFADARGNLAVILLGSGKGQEARELIDEGLKILPADRLLNLLAARCDRETGDPESAVRRLEAIADPAVGEPGNDRITGEIYLELGKGFDQQGDTEKAARCFAEAERIARGLPQAKYAMEQKNPS